MIRPIVVLAGPPGSGKSTVAGLLADQLHVDARDTDRDVEVAAGQSVAEIFIDHGEPRFRELERSAVAAALTTHAGVLSLGGGAILDPASQDALREYSLAGGTVVFLDVSLAHAAPRIGFNQSRPLLLGNPRAQWQSLMEQRRPTYEALADLRVLTDARTPDDIAQEIAAALAAPSGRTET